MTSPSTHSNKLLKISFRFIGIHLNLFYRQNCFNPNKQHASQIYRNMIQSLDEFMEILFVFDKICFKLFNSRTLDISN